MRKGGPVIRQRRLPPAKANPIPRTGGVIPPTRVSRPKVTAPVSQKLPVKPKPKPRPTPAGRRMSGLARNPRRV